ncbi:MAG TPA: response regulator transcription factor [Gemmatimonadaceae bacterium]
MSRILVVEDDPAILRGLRHALEYEKHEVLAARSGEEGLQLLRDRHPDLVVLDVMLPTLSGFELCRRARQEGIRTPILMLTARGEDVDQVMGLDLGADDYVRKPFSVPALLARVRALLRRAHPREPLPTRTEFDDVSVDFESFEASRDGRPVSLAPKEFAVLRYLIAREGKVVSRHELLEEVWGFEQMPTTRTVDNHVALLRSKLEQDPAAPRRLLTVHGVGYKFVR